jgi:hypothetical protein
MRAFAEVLKDVRDGDLVLELATKMQDLVAAVKATDKAGKLTLTLQLKSMKQGAMLVLQDDIKLVLPEPDRQDTTFVWATEDNDLTRRDPRQPKLPEMGVVRSMAEGREQSNG